MAAENGVRRTGRRHRHDRAGHGLRPSGREDDRQEGRQPVCAERSEDLHHQRSERGPHLRRRQDRSGSGRQGHLAHHGRNRRSRGLPPRPQSEEARPEGAGHVGTLFRRREGAADEPSGRRRGQGLRPAHAAASAGAPHHRRAGLLRDGKGRRADRRIHQGPQGLRQVDPRLPEHAVQTRRMQDRGDHRPRLRRRLRGEAARRQARCDDRGHGQMVDHREGERDRRYLSPVLRRLWLHDGISDRSDVCGRPHPEDLRRRQ